jgi:uncharacterized peroxidase-related enzyme
MITTSISKLPLIDEVQASGEVGTIFSAIKRELGVPEIPNSFKSLAVSPAALKVYWAFASGFYTNLTLPQSLVSMILYTVAEHNKCQYCKALNEVSCRLLGVDEQTLSDLAQNLGNVSPERVREIIQFSLKVNADPQGLTEQDYDRLRQQGVSDAELVEIILVAATARFNDTLADTLKFDVDESIRLALKV